MGTPIPIPKILSISWWWLFAAGLTEYYARTYFIHVPGWIPYFVGMWFLGQAYWLKMAEPKSWTLYLSIASFLVSAITPDVPKTLSKQMAIVIAESLPAMALWIAAIFVFRSEFMQHFNEVEPRKLKLSGIMTYFFNYLYFQYWFRQLYVEQNEVDLRLAGKT